MKIAIIGTGNVGTHLERAFSEKKLEVELLNSRTLEGLDNTFDYVLICVSDRAIEDTVKRIASKIKGFSGIVAHTSGSVNIDILLPYFTNTGVIYPLQTFSKDQVIPCYSEIPFYIEASNYDTETSLLRLASNISKEVHLLSSIKREKLHVASVFACNFVNAMYEVASEILKDNGIPFDAIKPLIKRTAEKVMTSEPKNVQTGPASRGDNRVMERHIELLKNGLPQYAEIYEKISELIMLQKNDIIGKQIAQKA